LVVLPAISQQVLELVISGVGLMESGKGLMRIVGALGAQGCDTHRVTSTDAVGLGGRGADVADCDGADDCDR
jgi:hypothetical protein